MEQNQNALFSLTIDPVTKSHLTITAKVPGIENEKFQECVKNAEENCPISKLLNTSISSEAKLA